MSSYFAEEYERHQIEDWTNFDIKDQLTARDERIEALELELDRISGILFKFSKLFAEEINV